MRARFPVFLTLLLAAGATPALSQAVTADDIDFVREHLKDIVRVEPTRVTDPAVTSVFAVPIYRVSVEIHEADGTVSNGLIVGRVGDAIVPISRPSTDQDCPEIHKMLNPQFKLTGTVAAETLQKALDAVFPAVTDESKAAVAFRRAGNTWTFIRGKFFDDVLGFVMTTDASGTITGVKFALKLPAKAGA